METSKDSVKSDQLHDLYAEFWMLRLPPV